MATPRYVGAGQAIPNTGLFGRLGSYFGNSQTPAYAGVGQPSSTARGLLGISTPAYAAAPVRAPLVDAEIEADAEECVEERPVVMCPIDSEALAAGQIAIVVPRQDT